MDLDPILKKHAAWINNEEGGEKANLREANLREANLLGANLLGANLREANLREANLLGANLWGANLQGANLQGANLREANLRGADLWGANLWGANPQGANLQGADLRGADLQEADLRGANLQEANLQGANLRGANLRGATLPNFQIVPEEGDFIGYKKLHGGVICKLKIIGERTSSLVGRKCRCSKAIVLEGEGYSSFDLEFEYKIGAIVEPDKYDGDIRVECSHGIHFFITRKEAEEYQ